MAGQPGREQSSFASGELGDLLAERKNLKYYRSGLKLLQNGVVLAQGPTTLRPYTRQLSRRRNHMLQYGTAGAGYSAPSGGNASFAIDGDPGTALVTAAVIGGPLTVFTFTFPVLGGISAVDLVNYRANTNGRIAVQYSTDNLNWSTLNGDRKLVTGFRSRRFCAPPAQSISAVYWRVVVSGLAAATPIYITDIKFWGEQTYGSEARLRPFSFSRLEAYDLVLMTGHGDVYAADGNWLTGFALPLHGPLSLGRWRQQLNTGLLFCDSYPTWRVFRENSDYEWQTGPAPYSSIPDHDFGDVEYTNGQTSIWSIGAVNMDPSAYWTITVDGEESDAMPFLTDRVAGAFLLQETLEKLPNLSAGITIASMFNDLVITFSGEGNEGNVIVNSTRVINKADGAAPWIRIQKGKVGGEPIYSSGRGYPRCGTFFQQRLITGGARSVPNAFICSMTGDYWDMNTELSAATGAFVAPMDTDQDETIEELIVTSTLLIFTSRAEYWLNNPALSKDTPPNPKQASSHGCAEGVPIVENEGAAVFASRDGSVLCEFRYNETDQTYITTRASLLAPHLVKGVTDMAIQRSAASNDANVLFYTQADGSMRMVTMLREQDIIAFSRVVSDGIWKSVSVNAANRVTALVARLVNGSYVYFVERFEDGLLLDQAVSRTLAPPSNVIGGLADYEDATVWVLGDGDVYGPFVVAGNSIALPVAVTNVTIGRWAPFRAETLAPAREVGPEIVVQSNIGFHTVRASVKDTTSIALGANGQPIEDMSLLNYGGPVDVPALNNAFTGLVERDGIPGDQDKPSMVVTQVRPGRITLLSITGEGDL